MYFVHREILKVEYDLFIYFVADIYLFSRLMTFEGRVSILNNICFIHNTFVGAF